MDKKLYDAYVQILREELKPAMGCTEPIAVAYAGALARQTLNHLPETVKLVVSGNIIKNVKSVIVPHTGGRKGLKIAPRRIILLTFRCTRIPLSTVLLVPIQMLWTYAMEIRLSCPNPMTIPRCSRLKTESCSI